MPTRKQFSGIFLPTLYDDQREVDQLLQEAIFYLSIAKNMVTEGKVDLELSVDSILADHVSGILSDEEKLLAHLSSAAVRLCFLCEKYELDPPLDYRHLLVQRLGNQWAAVNQISSKIEDHIHLLLRDTAADAEVISRFGGSTDFYEALQRLRKAILSKLNIKTALDYLDLALGNIKGQNLPPRN